jgi:hypothetical protein
MAVVFLFSPLTSSVLTWMNFLMPHLTAASSSLCVPTTLVSVKAKELPKDRSTCDMAAKCITVSMLYCLMQRSTAA